MLDSLTGSPFSDDVLLFAVPVCADTDNLSQVEHLPPVTEEGGHVTPNGLLDKNGKVVNLDVKLVFNKKKHLCRKRRRKRVKRKMGQNWLILIL